MERLFIFSTLMVLLLVIRVSYIRGLCDDWNNQLAILIEKKKNKNNHHNPEKFLWMEDLYLNPWRCWWKLHLYEVKHFVKNPFIIQEIHKQVQEKYPC
jgi:hypothetical protein